MALRLDGSQGTDESYRGAHLVLEHVERDVVAVGSELDGRAGHERREEEHEAKELEQVRQLLDLVAALLRVELLLALCGITTSHERERE